LSPEATLSFVFGSLNHFASVATTATLAAPLSGKARTATFSTAPPVRASTPRTASEDDFGVTRS
jgi:hypothetical protein